MNKKEFLVIIIITFIVFMVWAIADVIYTKPKIDINPKVETILNDKFESSFNQKTLEAISNLSVNQPTGSPSASPTPNNSAKLGVSTKSAKLK